MMTIHHLRNLLVAAVMACPILFACNAFAGKTYYVRTCGNDKSDGLSAETAFATIQKAVSKCNGRGYLIYVGPGTYPEEVEIGLGDGKKAKSGNPNEPNRIIGDIAGAVTGDEAGPVIVDGGGVRNYGVRLEKTDSWAVQYITFQDQKAYTIYAYSADDFRLQHCTINVPASYAYYQYRSKDVRIEDNVLVRDDSSGHCIFVYYCSGDILISRNRMSLLGDEYLSTGYQDGLAGWRWRRQASKYVYGIGVLNWSSEPSNVLVDNNVISDAYLGIYVYAVRQNDTVRVAHNAVTGSLYPVYSYNYQGTAEIADNIVADSYYGVTGYGYRGDVTVSGLLAYNIKRSRVVELTGADVTGLIEDLDPKFRAPASGDFSLLADSPAIDAGTGLVAVATDIRGVSRPTDGNGDGEAIVDLGAYEYYGAVDDEGTPRIVQWREREPD